MYSPPQPLEKPFFKPTFCQARLEVYKIRVIKRENNNSDRDSDSESESEMQFPVDPLKDEYKATEDPDKFKGRIFIGNKYFFQEMYNSKKKEEDSLYVDLPTNQSNKRKEEEEYFPVMGPETGIMVEDCFHVIVHPDADNVGADEKYEDAARAKYLKPLFGFIPTDYVRPGRVPWPTAWFDTPFEFEVGTARHLVTLDCVMHKHSKAVHLEIRWLNQQHATTEHMYIFGQIYVTSTAFPFKLSYLLDTPPYKAVKAQLGNPIPLLRSVVALPYDNNFVVKARLFYSNTIAEEFRFHPLVHDDVTFPFVDEDKDAVASTFCPSHPFERYGLYSPVTYESKKLIRDSGSGCLLEVTAKMKLEFVMHSTPAFVLFGATYFWWFNKFVIQNLLMKTSCSYAVGDDTENLLGKALSGVPLNNVATLGGNSSDQFKWKRKLRTRLEEVNVYPILAALYLVKNLLQYYIFAHVDTPGYQIIKNLNIISTG